jgi:hypothetical protein
MRIFTERLVVGPNTDGRKCVNCTITLIPENVTGMCDVCWAMLEAVSNEYWHNLQVAYSRRAG